jgi:hypothetical protein
VPYRLLDAFSDLFKGHRYLHRRSHLGDWVALHLYEDLLAVRKSSKFTARVQAGEVAVNVRNRRRGIKARRGDGTFGEVVPGTPTTLDEGFLVPRGMVATIEIGTEVKILAKAMIKQIERVEGDLLRQVDQFKSRGGQPLCVGVVGINSAEIGTSYEGRRAYTTDGKKNKHPVQEAPEAERRLVSGVGPHINELIVLRFRATNKPPYNFEWVNERETELDYAASLVRLSREYETRF